MKPCFLQSDLTLPSALKSSSYLKLTSILEWSQQLCNAKWHGKENGKKTNKQTTDLIGNKKKTLLGQHTFWCISLPLTTGDICLHSFTEKFGTPRLAFWPTECQEIVSRNIEVTNVLSYKVNTVLHTCIHVLRQLLSWELYIDLFCYLSS